jgi:DNA-binding response OmpR family regulator
VRALLVALDLPTAAEIGAAFERAWPGTATVFADSLDEARAALDREPVDVVLAGDTPAGGGLGLCADICARTSAPVILVSERRGIIDRIRAAELGVCDFLWRPLTERATVATVRAALDHARQPAPATAVEALEAGPLRIDYSACSVTVDGHAIDLAPDEYALLYHLTRNANSVLAYETLLAKVWGRRYRGEADVLTVHVERLRLKLGASARPGPRITRRDGIGFAFEHRARNEA